MKKMIFMLFAVALLGFTACNKDKEVEQVPAESSFEFKIEQANFFKGTNDDVPQCLDLDMDYVVFDISGTTYTTALYEVNGELLSEVIKLPIGTYHLTSFLVYNDNGTPNTTADDVLVKASPAPDSDYYDLISNQLVLDIEVEAFYKKQIEVDVLCFEDLYYESFGFTWFELNDYKIERTCFFGDICTGCYEDFAGSLYADQPEGVQMDMPAIFKVKVYKEGEADPIRTFDNTSWLGVGSCLEVYWPNNLDIVENFTFELWVLLPSGNGFDYELVNTWDVQDDMGPDAGNDGVVDFVLGTCAYQGSDYEFEYYMNLPEDTFTMVATNDPSYTNNAFYNISLTGINPGYVIGNGVYGVFCSDLSGSIPYAPVNNVMAYNSLSNNLPGNFPMSPQEVVYVNYFMNHLSDYFPGWSYDIDNPGLTLREIQRVIWAITDGLNLGTDLNLIYNHVIDNGANYEVPPGGYAGIIFWPEGGGTNVQMIFTVLDPCE